MRIIVVVAAAAGNNFHPHGESHPRRISSGSIFIQTRFSITSERLQEKGLIPFTMFRFKGL